MNKRRIKSILNKQQKAGGRQMDRLKYIMHKVIDRTKDSYFNFTHAHLIRNMVTAAELDLVKRESCDKDLVLIAFYPTGGFGDYNQFKIAGRDVASYPLQDRCVL